MRIVYPYNEILPKKRAHDVYIFQECVALAKHFDVHLLCGKGSQDETSLYQHYKCHPSSSFHLHSLSIVRKNNLLNLSWNFPFFYSAQKKIHALKPDMVFLSVLKQAEFHLRHKLPKTRYFYEVHQLQWYPGMVANQKMVQEKKILQKADVVITTTQELANILKSPPYCLSNPIEVVPLAVDAQFIPKRTPFSHILTYCGQLYRGQGIDLLLEALAKTTDWKLHIIGGKPDEIAYYEKMAKDLNIDKRASF